MTIMNIIVAVKYDFTIYSSVYIIAFLYQLCNVLYNKVLMPSIIQGECTLKYKNMIHGQRCLFEGGQHCGNMLYSFALFKTLRQWNFLLLKNNLSTR